MKAKLSLILSLVLLTGYMSVFAADITTGDVKTTDNTNKTTDIKAGNVSTTDNSDGTTDLNAGDVNLDAPSVSSGDKTTLPADGATTEAPLNAASGKEVVVAPKMGIGNYSEVPCDKDFFTTNSCNQCFDGGRKMAGEKIAGLTDTWTNLNATEQVIYKDEQKMPEFINLGGEATKWLSNPVESDKFYKYADDIAWSESATGSGKQEFLLESNKTVNFLESDLGASYALQSTDKKEGEAIGMIKFNIALHDTDATAKESEVRQHIECAAFYAGAPAPITPVAQTPVEATKVKTGPESVFLLLAALFLSFVFIRYRKKA